MSNIKVVNAKVSELRKRGYSSLQIFLDSSPNHLYVGRNMNAYVPGAKASKWQNPFKLAHYNNDVQKVLELYKTHIKSSYLYNELDELEGKTLACWCFPSPCHATVLKELLDEKIIGKERACI